MLAWIFRLVTRPIRIVFFRTLGMAVAIPVFFGAVIKALLFLRRGLRVKDRPLPPAILLAPRWGEHKYIYLPDLKMHYVEKGDHTKPLLVFLHGFPEFWFSWRHQLEHFATDFWCVAPDLRGYGDTDRPRGITNYRLDLLATDIKNLVQGLGQEQCYLVTHDWGSCIGYRLCEMYPSLVRSYVSCNGSHLQAIGDELRNNVDQLMKSWYIFAFQCPVVPEMLLRLADFTAFEGMHLGTKDEEVVEAYKFTFKHRNALTGPINYYRNALQLGPALVCKDEVPAGKIKVPICSIYGINDKYLGEDAVKGSWKYAESFYVSYVGNSGHWVQMEQPEEVNRIIDQHFKLHP